VKAVMRRDRRFAVAILFPGVKIIKKIMTLLIIITSLNSFWMMKSFEPDTGRQKKNTGVDDTGIAEMTQLKHNKTGCSWMPRAMPPDFPFMSKIRI
jgi:hypothetical protein